MLTVKVKGYWLQVQLIGLGLGFGAIIAILLLIPFTNLVCYFAIVLLLGVIWFWCYFAIATFCY